MEINNSTFKLCVRFKDDSSSFTNGFEAGMIWQNLKDGTIEHTMTVHTENTSVCLDMAAHFGYTADISPSEVDGWSYAHFKKFSLQPLRLVPKG